MTLVGRCTFPEFAEVPWLPETARSIYAIAKENNNCDDGKLHFGVWGGCRDLGSSRFVIKDNCVKL